MMGTTPRVARTQKSPSDDALYGSFDVFVLGGGIVEVEVAPRLAEGKAGGVEADELGVLIGDAGDARESARLQQP